uniref:Uncharacterized protein n=1 Tax=Arundo donax TaxID=35708 RepID=A0A0A9AP47_ARUDO
MITKKFARVRVQEPHTSSKYECCQMVWLERRMQRVI